MVNSYNESSGDSECIRRLAKAFAARCCEKYQTSWACSLDQVITQSALADAVDW